MARQKAKKKTGAVASAKKTDPKNISYCTLFRFSSKRDKIRISLACVSAIMGGSMYPYSIYLTASVINNMIAYEKGTLEADILMNHMYLFSLQLCCIGTTVFTAIYLSTSMMNISAINQVYRIRGEYLKAVLNQDFTYFDTQQIGDFASKMSENVLKLEEGIGDKLATAIYFTAGGVACISMALYQGWKLALLCLMSAPVSFFLVGLIGKLAQRLSKQATKQSAEASAIAEEVLSSIRTVFAFNGQQKELERYRVPLSKARKIDIKKECFTGLTMGMLFLCIFSSYGLSFYLGIYLIVHEPENYNAGVMFAVFMGVMTGMQLLGLMGAVTSSFGSARGAGASIFNVIDNRPTINTLLDAGIRPSTVEGNIEMHDVYFRYSTRPDTPVLEGLNLTVARGQSVALVGPSGCGKSTTIQLISRYYEANSGKVLLDGRDVRELSVRWLRSQIGLVSQEPVLFNTSVRDNIRYGREDASDAEIEDVARQANAHKFIKKLPKGYDTLVGERGASLSGGQKQRIAIARALLRNPPILLLDEATSALDTASEAKVQQALNKAAAGRTTVIVAHRLSTIRHVDLICVIKDGKVAEKGTHEELLKAQGLFYAMLKLQQPLLDEWKTEASLTVEKDMETISIVSEYVEDEEAVGITVRKLKHSEENKSVKMSLCELMRLNAPEWKAITLGCIAAIITGFAMPLFFLVFGQLIGALSSLETKQLMTKVVHVSMSAMVIGLVVGGSNLLEAVGFGMAGAGLTERLRCLMFQHLLRQDVAFFDDNENSTGALCARLSAEAARVQAATGQRVGTILQALGSVGLALVLAFYFEWRIAVLELSFFPILSIIVYYQTKIAVEESTVDEKTTEKSTQLALEAVQNVRTVVALGREHRVLEDYIAELHPALSKSYKSAHCRGIVTALSRSLLSYINASTLTLGAHLLVNNKTRAHHVIIATQVLNMASTIVQNLFTYYPEFQKGISAASRVKALIEKEPGMSDALYPVTNFVCAGDASFAAVHFRYPTRPGIKILRGLDLEIKKGETLALVGESGCGKSTVVSLLQRFYDPEAGIVALSDVALPNIALPNLLFKDIRASYGLVSQEPVLFDRTVSENIAYGDNSRVVSEQEIINAATQANIHNFIKTLPQGYDSNIGAKGVQLSGGQKQRIAIARALVRQPKILLLDEATSALDTESEKVVQEALDHAKKGRTCVMIAHRLSTVRDADAICVVKDGHVAERGTHKQLVEMKGLYYDLYSKGSHF